MKQIKIKLAVIALIVTASSCATQKGFNYAAHHRKTKAAMRKTQARNNGNDLINWRCTNH
jgi:hypothetical protein